MRWNYQALLAAGTLAVLLLCSPAQGANDALSGAIFTTTANGAIVNANTQYNSKCEVYLDGGPGPNAPVKAAGLPAGEYYFQVTDPSGKTLLSTDPVVNRRFRVSSDGVIVAYTGTGGPAHPTGFDLDQSEKHAITIQLANETCPADFGSTPAEGGVYKVWVTPVGDGTPTGGGFVGDPLKVDNGYSPGYYHGFLPARSKTDNFKVRAVDATFCLTLQKQVFNASSTDLTAGVGWPMYVTNSHGVKNTYYTELSATDPKMAEVKVCSLTPDEYTVREELEFFTPVYSYYFVAAQFINGVEQDIAEPVYSFVWQAGAPEPVILFQNKKRELE